MVRKSLICAASIAASSCGGATASIIPEASMISFQDGLFVEAGGVHNIHVTYNAPLDGELSIHYGPCDFESQYDLHHILGRTHVGAHPLAARHASHLHQRPGKFVWLPPSEAITGGCLHAFSNDMLVGRSSPVTIAERKQKRWEAAADVMDSMGPWFDGVEYLKEKEPEDVFVAAAKTKTIGIVGGGMSGLMTAHLLDSVGFHDWKIIEASGRIGGRVHTAYLNNTRPDEYQYQEMGPMRFPVSITYDDPAETIEIMDHRVVFQLADVLNLQNGNDSEYQIDFIPWIQSSDNAPISTSARRPDGTVPGTAETKSHPEFEMNSNVTYSNATAVAEASEAYEDWLHMDRERYRAIASNVYKSHRWSVDNGYFHFSEAGYLKYALNKSLNITDQVSTIADNSPSWAYHSVYFGATKWRTIDKGLTSLPRAFGPQVLNRTIFHTAVQGMSWDEEAQKMTLQYRNKDLFAMEPETMEFDYVVVAVPFSRVRLWRLPEYTSLLSRAINRMNYEASCKVALHYKTRFWEHLEHPIIGGCGSTDIPQISSICYPSYKINSTGPGVILGSYASGIEAQTFGAMSDEEHVAYVQRAMVEIHGKVAQEQFTGVYDRHCWEFDEFQAGAWASPLVGQQELYLPAYFQTEKHTVFVGEHTSITHAWIFSALDSALRGTTQLLLDMGLVDEAKTIVEFWMARWISV